MMRVVTVLLILIALGIAGITGYAYLGDLSPEQTEITLPVELDAN